MNGLFLLLIVIISTLTFGAVYGWAIFIVGVVTAIAFVLFARKGGLLPFSFSGPGRLVVAATAIFAYGLFQMVPLPMAFLGLVHPVLKTILAVPGPLPMGAPPASAAAQPLLPLFHAVSVYPFATELDLANIVIYLMVFLLAAFGFREKEEARILINMLVLFGFILAIFAIIQKATWNGKLYWFSPVTLPRAQPFGPFANKNHYAGWVNMIFPFALAMGLSAAALDRKVRYLLYGLAMAVTVVFSLSRGGIVALFAGLFVFCLYILYSSTSRRRFIPLLLFLSILVAFLGYIGVAPVLERFAQLDIPHHERITIWKATWRAFLDFPVFGSGFGTYEHAFKLYHPPTWFFYDMAHNDYLQLLMEAGVVGTAFVGAFLFFVARTITGAEWTQREVYLKGAFFASFTTIAVHSAVDFNLHIPSNAILLALLLGLSVSMSRLNEEEE